MADPIADSKTNVSGSVSAADIAAAAANSAAAQAAAAVAADAASSYQRDYSGQSSIVSDNDKDTGTDERYEVESGDRSSLAWLNNKATFDFHQTLNYEGVHRARRMEDEEREMRLRHSETEFNQRVENSRSEAEQRLRHYEDMHTMRYGVAGEMVEAIANRVWSTCPWTTPAA